MIDRARPARGQDLQIGFGFYPRGERSMRGYLTTRGPPTRLTNDWKSLSRMLQVNLDLLEAFTILCLSFVSFRLASIWSCGFQPVVLLEIHENDIDNGGKYEKKGMKK